MKVLDQTKGPRGKRSFIARERDREARSLTWADTPWRLAQPFAIVVEILGIAKGGGLQDGAQNLRPAGLTGGRKRHSGVASGAASGAAFGEKGMIASMKLLV